MRCLLVALLCVALVRGAEPAGIAPSGTRRPDFARVTVEPTWTSIYLGTVSLRMPGFGRRGGTYESPYTAKVLPFFFYNEQGRLSVDLDDDALARLGRGESVTFKGRAIRSSGEERPVEGKATPVDSLTGKLKVRVLVSTKIELIFNTTYRFAALPPP